MTAAFTGQMKRLLGLRFAPADLTTHWEALRDLPADVLAAAVTRAQRTRVDFPTPAELRLDADLARPRVDAAAADADRATDLPEPFTITVPQVGTTVSVTREWRYDCERCNDSGWASWWCGACGPRTAPWMPDAPCERRGAHGDHDWVGRCACWEMNPTLIRKRAAQQRYAEKPGKAA